MNIGMNIHVEGDGADAAKFIRICSKAGIKAVKLLASGPLPKVTTQALKDTTVKAYVATFSAHKPGFTEPLYLAFRDGFEDLKTRLSAILASIDEEDCLAVGLPEGLHLITQVGPTSKKFGLTREWLAPRLDALASLVRAKGFDVAMPVRSDDIEGNVWEAVNFDIYDLEAMLSRDLAETMGSKAMHDQLKGKRYWYGKAGVIGGYIMPAEQARFIHRLANIKGNAEWAFLWSEPASDKWAWSQDGAFVLDLMPDVLTGLSVRPIVPEGDPALQHWKSGQRVSRGETHK